MRSALVAAALLLLSTHAHADSTRYVVPMTVMNIKVPPPVLWAFRESREACGVANREYLQSGRPVGQSCTFGNQGQLPIGTEVEVVSTTACGDDMTRIRVSTGKLAGKVGCVEADALSTKRPKR